MRQRRGTPFHRMRTVKTFHGHEGGVRHQVGGALYQFQLAQCPERELGWNAASGHGVIGELGLGQVSESRGGEGLSIGGQDPVSFSRPYPAGGEFRHPMWSQARHPLAPALEQLGAGGGARVAAERGGSTADQRRDAVGSEPPQGRLDMAPNERTQAWGSTIAAATRFLTSA